MAWVEAASVYYIRAMVDRIDPYQNHPLPIRGVLGQVELVREAATLVMLATLGMLAGRTRRAQAGYTAIAFGVWDIFYYVFLRMIGDWPRSLFDWDILFLLPLRAPRGTGVAAMLLRKNARDGAGQTQPPFELGLRGIANRAANTIHGFRWNADGFTQIRHDGGTPETQSQVCGRLLRVRRVDGRSAVSHEKQLGARRREGRAARHQSGRRQDAVRAREELARARGVPRREAREQLRCEFPRVPRECRSRQSQEV
jgi:hypothetical protein